MTSSDRAITVANDQSLTALVGSARRRVVAMGPAFSEAVAEAICERWMCLGPDAVTVIVDVDPEVYRLGYGDAAALHRLEKTAADLGAMLNRQDGIRICLIIADETTVVYSPTPRLIEAGPQRPETPNAIVLNCPPEEVARELGQGPEGLREQRVGLDKAERSRIAEVRQDLVRNPPQRFDIARTVRVFNAYFEFVDFEMTGTQFQRFKARIPSDLMGLAKDEKTQKQLQASFKLIDESSNVSGKPFEMSKHRLVREYLTSLPGYGHVILRTLKPKFERKVRQLKMAVERFQKRVQEDLQAALDESRATLTEALLPAVKAAPPKRWHKHIAGQFSDAVARRLLEDDLNRAFRSAEELAQKMKVKVVFKGVTYESLRDEQFVAMARDRLPALEALHLEYEAVQGEETDAWKRATVELPGREN